MTYPVLYISRRHRCWAVGKARSLMDLVIDHAALSRNRSSAMALKVLEAAIERKLGFPVSVRQVAVWCSPTVFEEDRIPARYVTVEADGRAHEIPAEIQALLMQPSPVTRSAREMIAASRARKKAVQS